MRLAFPVVVVATLFASLCARTALAQERTAGAATIGVMVATRSTEVTLASGAMPRSLDFGGDAVADLWADIGILRIGGAVGVVPLTSENATHARVLLPFGPSVALSIHDEGSHLTFEPRIRGGVWAGATEFGLMMDVWGSFGLWLGYDLGAHVVLALGVDLWVIHAQDFQDERVASHRGFGTFVFVSPGLSISWRP